MGWQSKPSKQERYLAFCPLPDAKASKDLEELLDEDGALPNRSKLAQLIEKAREKKQGDRSLQTSFLRALRD
jgi:hypothetical protein